jgi:hypothetical protein
MWQNADSHLRWFNLKFFDFTIVWKPYGFSRKKLLQVQSFDLFSELW